MSAERKKVLELLATGKITTEEAEKLLNKLDTLDQRLHGAHAYRVNQHVGKSGKYLGLKWERPATSVRKNETVI